VAASNTSANRAGPHRPAHSRSYRQRNTPCFNGRPNYTTLYVMRVKKGEFTVKIRRLVVQREDEVPRASPQNDIDDGAGPHI
jgi:hypothetical protein